MSECAGKIPVGTNTDRDMAEFVDQRANELGVSKSEFLRRLLDHYRHSRAGELDCPYCNEELRVRL